MIAGINHITITVSDLDTSLQFYTKILMLTAEVRWDSGAYLSGPNIWLCLTLGTPVPSDDYSHIAFSIDKTHFDSLEARINNAGYGIWQENRSEGDSIYFLDPDGHKLEVHCGDLQQRLKSLHLKPYKALQWLNRPE